ncbi:MAG TPA: LacI family DNA-binding transcriptional regulator [Gaiellaceae bacterium]|nr:LacI family DNA-binding transcriptional regulator [Gaiellaceae bacterium]
MSRPTIRDVAERAGVSIATVSRVLNARADVSADTRARVAAAAETLGYAADSVARALVSQRTRLVGVVVGDNAGHRDLSLVFFGKVLSAIARRLAQSGYEPLLLQDVSDQRFDAAILIGVDSDDQVVRTLLARELPVVGVDVRCPGVAYVGSDHAGGVRLALAHLYAHGHRRIGHIAGAMNTIAGSERHRAFLAESFRLGLHLPADYVRYGDFSSASGYRETVALLALAEPPTAVVAGSDLMALAVLQAIWDSGRAPGRDVAVVGFDDIEAAALAHPSLTTIRQARDDLGAAAAELAIAVLEDAPGRRRDVIVPVELVVRDSSSAELELYGADA